MEVKLHRELVDVVAALPAVDWMADIGRSRDLLRDAVAEPVADPRIVVDERRIAGGDGQDMAVRIYRRAGLAAASPAVVWCHGGGFALGGLDSEDGYGRALAVEQGLVIVAPDYRLAPENPYPAGLDDCCAALQWVAGAADHLGVRTDRLGIGGHSAGGALAAGVAFAARDRGGPSLSALYLGYPVLHDDPRTPSMAAASDPRLWNARQATAMWSIYLAGDPAHGYAAPARITDLAGLPYTYVVVHGADPHRDEALDFIDRLIAAGVVTEAHLVPGAPHMADVYAPESSIVRRSISTWMDALGTELHR